MAPTHDPQPGHPLIQHLDKAFTNAPALAGYLEYLAHPEQNYGPRALDESGGESNHWPTISPPNENPPYLGSVLRDLTIPEFFAAADVLSGQDIDGMGKAVDALEELRHRKDGDVGDYKDSADRYTLLTTALDMFLPDWDTTAGNAVKDAYGPMQVWYNRRHEDLYVMSKRLVEFGAVIATARRNVNELMGKLVDRIEQHTNRAEGKDAILYVVGKVLGFATKADPTGLSAMFFSDLYGQAIKAAESETAGDGLPGNTFYQILHSYLNAARAECEEASKAVRHMLTANDGGYQGLYTLREGTPPPPVLTP
jgi:hypothetical protein